MLFDYVLRAPTQDEGRDGLWLADEKEMLPIDSSRVAGGSVRLKASCFSKLQNRVGVPATFNQN
jgi:hypothetical protein